MRYARKYSYVWSADLAYVVGLIASDGSLSKDRRHIDFTSKDMQLIELFAEAIGRKFTVSIKTARSSFSAYRVQFSDVALYDFLLDVGLTKNKSTTITSLNVPALYFSHFLRGVFDGDGSVYGFHDKRWRSSFMFYSVFYSASKPFLVYLQEVTQACIGIKGSISTSQKFHRLQYAKKESVLLYHFLYKDDGGKSLSRKKVAFKNFILEEKNAIIT